MNFFHILDAIVAQQNERAISHIEEARDFFPEPYVDREICREAIEKIKKGDPESAFAYEAVEKGVPPIEL